MTKTKRTSKNQLARELAMKARADELERQNKIMEATKDGFLALGELGPVVARFGAAASTLRSLGEAKRDVARTFGLSMSMLTMLERFLPAPVEAISDESDAKLPLALTIDAVEPQGAATSVDLSANEDSSV